jgi:hypothetical protein
MQKDERDLLEVLKFELQFLEKGGYGRSPREPWRPRFIFEDSPTCMNYDCQQSPEPCSHCILTQLVPPDLRSVAFSCRRIPLNGAGEDLDSLYRWADEHEIEEAVRNWLRATIESLEQERKVARLDMSEPGLRRGDPMKGTPLYQKLHPKCANPVCPTAFHWLGGGKFFRFRPDQAIEGSGRPAAHSSASVHGVQHFWLCESCSDVFTLVYEEGSGVVLKLLHLELPLAEVRKELPAASQSPRKLATPEPNCARSAK